MNTVREGQVVWPYCPNCGCRLNMVKANDDNYYFRHYDGHIALFGDSPISTVFVDARGCMCVDHVWSLDDRILYQGVV